jgi:hypothetical protein
MSSFIKGKAVKVSDEEYDEDMDTFDGQPDTSGGENVLFNQNGCSIFMHMCKRCTVVIMAILSVLFIAVAILLAVVLPSANMMTIEDVACQVYVPTFNETDWISGKGTPYSYPPWIELRFTASIHNPNKFSTSFESSVDVFAYDINNENETSYRYMDTFVLDKIKFDTDKTEQIARNFNMTNPRLLKQIGAWVNDAPPKMRDLKLKTYSTKGGIDLFKLSLDLPTFSRDVSALV